MAELDKRYDAKIHKEGGAVMAKKKGKQESHQHLNHHMVLQHGQSKVCEFGHTIIAVP